MNIDETAVRIIDGSEEDTGDGGWFHVYRKDRYGNSFKIPVEDLRAMATFWLMRNEIMGHLSDYEDGLEDLEFPLYHPVEKTREKVEALEV